MITLDRQVAEVRREVGLRRRVYPRWVSQGKMTQVEADRRIEAMEAVQKTLENLRDSVARMQKPDLFPST